MPQYLISFPSRTMDVPPEELPAVGAAARAVVGQARDAGVLVYAGGLDDSVAPVLVAADGTATEGSSPETAQLDGGFTIVDVPSREEALAWAARIAQACRCPQELRVFAPDEQA